MTDVLMSVTVSAMALKALPSQKSDETMTLNGAQEPI
jgi:hypothetical protein